METDKPDLPDNSFPHMEAPEVPLPKKTIPGSIGCLSAFLAAVLIIALVVAHFYSMSDYTTRLNVDGTYHFSGKLVKAKKVLFTDRYKLVVKTEGGEEIVLPPLPNPSEGETDLLNNLAPGTCIDGDLTSKEGFLHDLSIKLGDQPYHFDTAAGWLKVTEATPEATPEEEEGPLPELPPEPEGDEEPAPPSD